LQSGPHRTSGCICRTVSTISPRTRRASGMFHPRSAELPSRHSGAMLSIEPGMTERDLRPVRIEPLFQSLPASRVVIL
jgi:hypothetical protein